MIWKTAKFVLAVLGITLSAQVFACAANEYEKCWSVNLGPLGTAKDCKCLPKFGGVAGQIGEESKRALNNLAKELGKTPEAIQACIKNVGHCANEIVAAPLAVAVQAYIEGLYRQSEGKTQSFSPAFIALAQPYFSVDLSRITFADDINTGTGMSVSYCDRIFFAGHGDLWTSKSELHHVLHELEHTVQCQRRGKRTYLAEYVLKAGLDVLKTGRFTVHDIHDFEVAANAKANQLTETLWSKIRSGALPVPRANGASPSTGAAPTFPAMIPVRFCRTPVVTCSIPPALIPMGSPCFCNRPYGPIQGSAF